MTTYNGAITAASKVSAAFGGTVLQTRQGAVGGAATAKASFGGYKPPAVVTGFPFTKLKVKVELLLNGTWTDITHYVLVRDDITISPLGRTDETSSMQSGSMTLTLKNTDGRFTPNNASGAYYPYIQLNTQLRLSINDQSVNGTVYTGYRFWGEVSEWPPVWDNSGRDVSETITVAGIWRRLSQGTQTLGSPFTRWNTKVAQSYTVAGYWPMEDGTGSTTFASVAQSTADAMTIIPTNGAPTMASCTAFPGSNAIPQLNGAELSGVMHTSSSPSQIMFRFLLFVQSGGDTGSGASVLARLHLGTNTSLNYVDISLGPAAGGPFVITGNSSTHNPVFSGTLNDAIWGIPILCQVGLVKSGSNVIWSFNTMLPGTTGWYGTVTGTATGISIADASSVIFSPGAAYKGVSIGQAMVIYGNPSISTDASALAGWAGENAVTRFNRICTEEGIPHETIGSSSTTLGPQIDDTIVNVLQAIEQTDYGQLYETRGQFGLGYRTMASLQNQSPALTLNYPSAQLDPSLAPVNDDSLVRNDVTLTNYDGYSVRVFLQNGARSLNPPPNGVGSGYAYTQNVNSTSHTQVLNVAEQILNCGCTFENRYPTVTVNLARTTTASLFSKVPSMRVGDYLQVTNMPSFMGGGTEKQLTWGWTETINHTTWKIAFNTIPEAPWESSFNPGTFQSGQVPGSPVTAAQSGSVSGAQIAEGAIIGLNLASGTISGGKIASGTITANNIANATITGTQIASGTISGVNIQNASITGSQIQNATITGTNIAAGTITASNITNATITSSQISATAGITGGQIGSGTITAGNITNATITNVQIAGGTITGSNIGSSTITGANLTNATITSVQIANGTITTTQISNSANITGTQVASGTITAANIAANTITATQIAASTITGSLIAANTIAAGNIVANTITASQIAAGTITGTQIAASISLTTPSIIIDGTSGGDILIYSSTPANGNLIGVWSGTSGTDAHSNTYVAGMSAFSLQLFGTTSPGTPPSNSTYLFSSTGGVLNVVLSSSYAGVLAIGLCNITEYDNNLSGTYHRASTTWSVPANDARIGTCYKLKCRGYASNTAAHSLYWSFVAFGSNVVVQLSGSAFSSAPTNLYWVAEAEIAVVTAGASGTVIMGINVTATTVPLGFQSSTTWAGTTTGNAISVDTTVAQTAELDMKWDAGTSTIAGYYSTFDRTGA